MNKKLDFTFGRCNYSFVTDRGFNFCVEDKVMKSSKKISSLPKWVPGDQDEICHTRGSTC